MGRTNPIRPMFISVDNIPAKPEMGGRSGKCKKGTWDINSLEVISYKAASKREHESHECTDFILVVII